jgi:PAS domain S-box-containing protein
VVHYFVAHTSVIIGTRLPRAAVVGSGVLLAVLVLAYWLGPWPASTVTAAGWTASALARTGGLALAWRSALAPDHRRAWGWLLAGSCLDLAAQLFADLQLAQGAVSTGVTAADVGYLAVYPCFLAAAWLLLAPRPRPRISTETLLDSTLLTLTAVAWAYELFVRPLAQGVAGSAVVGSVAYVTGALALLWLIGMLVLQASPLPRGGARLAIAGLIAYATADLLLGVGALPLAHTPGPALASVWNVANLTLGTAGVLAAAYPVSNPPAAGLRGGVAPRLLAVLVGILGLIAFHVRTMILGNHRIDEILVPLVGGLVIAARVAYALAADRRYETSLEHEVERQTQTLLDSLTATASAERNLRQIMEASPDPIALIDREGRVLDFAPDRPTSAGTTPTNRSLFDQVDSDTAVIVRAHIEGAFAGEVRRFEIPVRKPDGGRSVSSIVYAPIREHGAITKVLAISRDVTELRRAQSQLQQADKLAAMGQLVSGVAHEINNPAAIISGFAQTLMLDDLRPEQREIVEMVRDEAMRIGQITTNLLAFARMSGPERSLVDVNELVRRTHTLRAYHLNTLNVAVRLDLDESEPRVWANVSELQQMLLNFLINAEQALESFDGTREIALRTRAEATEVRIECHDSGPGIPADIRSRIFDPFFTTKPEGVGTGLGLSICYGIVKSHGGRIWLESEQGQGTTFHVVLPLDLRSVPRPSAAGETVSPVGNEPLAVLVVDDEPGIRQVTARFLNRSGMQVRAVSDGAEALRALRSQSFDVILCDVRMPGMNGRDFLIRLREQAPELVATLIFATGDTLDADTAALLADAGAPSLVKPFDFDALERLVRDVATRASRQF